MGGKLSPRFIPPSPFSAVFSLCVGVDGVFSFLCCKLTDKAPGLRARMPPTRRPQGTKKHRRFPSFSSNRPNFDAIGTRGRRGNACVLLTNVAKRQTSAVFARIAQQDPADGHHAEEEIVVQMRNDLQGTERGQA